MSDGCPAQPPGTGAPAGGGSQVDGCTLSMGAKTPLSMRRSKPAPRNRVVNLVPNGPGNTASARGTCSVSSSGRGRGNAATARHRQPRFLTSSEWLGLCVSHRTGSKSCTVQGVLMPRAGEAFASREAKHLCSLQQLSAGMRSKSCWRSSTRHGCLGPPNSEDRSQRGHRGTCHSSRSRSGLSSFLGFTGLSNTAVGCVPLNPR